ncbi:hypothetical protein [Edwardsiella tarda]|uniref:hypothetical protein n=1 Tax=Edwardsiella tarda TaxID=636 RepID=UPI00351BF5FB
MNDCILSDAILNERENAFYSQCLAESLQLSVYPPTPHEPPEKFIAYIKKNRENFVTSYSEYEFQDVLSKIQIKARTTLIPIEKIRWIASSQRACLFVWHFAKHYWLGGYDNITDDHQLRNKILFNDDGVVEDCFPSDSSSQIRKIIKLLDSNKNKVMRNNWLDKTKERWGKAFRLKSPFYYLSADDTEECLWVWEFLKKRSVTTDTPVDFPTTQDIYLAIHLAFDLWTTSQISPEDVKKFRNDFNRAKAQRKYKKNREDKINVQFYLDVKTREQLKKLSRSRRCSTGEMLQDLIKEEYNRQKYLK